MQLKIERAVLVYQSGIANVFEVDCFNMAASGRVERRLLQSDFRTCENYALGLGAAGVLVASAHCNMAGDIARCGWCQDLESAPFSDKQRPVFVGVSADLYFEMAATPTNANANAGGVR